jgi:hypothetical protein
MGKLCIIMQHTTLCTPCIAFILVSHTCIIAIGQVSKDPRKRRSQHKWGALTASKAKASPSASNHPP